MVSNQEVASAIVDILETLLEASEQLKRIVHIETQQVVFGLVKDMDAFLRKIYKYSRDLQTEVPKIVLPNACRSLLDSLRRAIQFYPNELLTLEQKLEFEFIPILEVSILQFEYWACIYPDADKMNQFFEKRVPELGKNKLIEKAVQTGKYKYDLSIQVIAFNKLDYTKKCINSLQKFMPKDINYELILVNHGSEDGTKEFFEHIKPNKQLDILINNSAPGAMAKVVEGKYMVSVSNDVLVTENVIDNLYKAICSDPQIAWIVPSTPNVSNLQTIETTYKNIEELNEFARKNNIYNPRRQEQRVRLCDPIEILRMETHQKCLMEMYKSMVFPESLQSFPDDKASLWFRRNGYKIILAKDAYCYHYGSITLKSEIESSGEQEFYLDGRQAFYDEFAVDPWGTGFCYSDELIKKLPCNDIEAINVLGINCGLGSNPLKIKEQIKENTGNLSVIVYNTTQLSEYLQDLKGVSDNVKLFKGIDEFKQFFQNIKFQYIVVEQCEESILNVISQLLEYCSSTGFLCLSMDRNKWKQLNDKKYGHVITTDNWVIIRR